MAIELESDIMASIGLGQHYTYFNGSGSCRVIRNAAIARLPQAVRNFRRKKAKIALPPASMLGMLEDISRAEESDYSLTRTWVALAEGIQMLIYIAENPDTPAQSFIEDWAQQHHVKVVHHFYGGRYRNGGSTVPEDYFSMGTDIS